LYRHQDADLPAAKQRIREYVWRLMEEKRVARFPRPIWGRIPNFEGAEEAARRLTVLPVFAHAQVVKVNPDAPQKPVRVLVLRQGKTLLVPTPRLRQGLLLVNPSERANIDPIYAATIAGSYKYGIPVGLSDLPKVDLIVAGSVAVSMSGARIGKGGGYSEIEYGILRELRLVDDETTVVTTVHELQIVDDVPMDRHDLIVDKIITPVRVVETERRGRRPTGIFWNEIGERKLKEIPILKDLAMLHAGGGTVKLKKNGDNNEESIEKSLADEMREKMLQVYQTKILNCGQSKVKLNSRLAYHFSRV
jgi:5-formyltetrahydrofolate cyclo-ligase